MVGLIALTVRRAREERLAQVAGSLTFTSVLSLVPLLAVSFALFTRIRVFRRVGTTIQEQLLAGLLPPDIARTVLRYLERFAGNAGGLTLVGSLFLVVTALAMLLTVENALNRIWQVKKDRPLLRRIGCYLLVLLLAPPALGASLWATSYLLAASHGVLRGLPPAVAFVLNLAPALLAGAGLAALFHFVPNTKVRPRDAIAGGLLAGIALELGKRGFTAYLLKVPTYKTLYGTFAVLPVFLLWVYFSWLVVLSAALLASNLAGGKRSGARRQPRMPTARRAAE